MKTEMERETLRESERGGVSTTRRVVGLPHCLSLTPPHIPHGPPGVTLSVVSVIPEHTGCVLHHQTRTEQAKKEMERAIGEGDGEHPRPGCSCSREKPSVGDGKMRLGEVDY